MRAVRVERIARLIGRRQHLDVESLEQRARTELRATRAARRSGRRRAARSRRRAGPGRRTDRAARDRTTPRSACRGTGDSARRIAARSCAGRLSTGVPSRVGIPSDSIEHAARVEHPEDVVIRDDQERGRLGKRRVVGQERRVDVPVRADEREARGSPRRDSARPSRMLGSGSKNRSSCSRSG